MRPYLPAALALILGFSLAPARAQTPPPAAASSAHESTALEDRMEEMRSAFGKLRKQAGDASANESSLALVARLRAAAEASVALTPARAEDVPEAERAKYVEAYQAKMRAFLAEVDKLEAALKAGDNPAAVAAVARLGAQQKEGHKDYRRSAKKE